MLMQTKVSMHVETVVLLSKGMVDILLIPDIYSYENC